MEQVAEALKQLKGGEWDQKMIAKIGTEIVDHSDVRIFPSQIKEVFDAIISIYGKKSPATEWHNCTDDSEFDRNELYDWEHDITGEVFTSSSAIEGVYPEYANKWADGTYGGYRFESNGTEFKTINGVRGIGYKALIAFDRNGRGIVFF
jgi:hypothetical protein